MPSPNAIEQIYNQICQVFGGQNPNQFFTMLMPATTLDQQTYVYDTAGIKPALVAEAESQLVDQMFDLTPVTASSNGQRVSEQYLQSLSVLVPNFDPTMPVLKSTLRGFLNAPMPANTTLDGKPFVGSLQEYYFALYGAWIKLKLKWDTDQQAEKDRLSATPSVADEKYLEWFEGVAEGRLAELDAAMGKVLAVFAPADMEALLGALAAGPGGEIDEATNLVKDLRLLSPSGGYVYPVTLIPNDWFLDLSSDINPTDLLQDPQFIGATITARRDALMASISQVQALLNSVPTPAAMQSAVTAMSSAQSTYTDAQNALLGTYADNTATAVEMYLSKHAKDKTPPSDPQALSELNQNAASASAAKGESPPAAGATTKGGAAITAADVQQIVAGQKNLIAAQSALLSAASGLAGAGLNLATAQSQTFANLPVLLARMQQQLGDLQTMQQQLSSSIASKASAAPTPALPSSVPAVSAGARAIIKAASDAAALPGATASKVATAVSGAIPATDPAKTALTPLAKVGTDAATATASASAVAVAVRTAATRVKASTSDATLQAAAEAAAAAGETEAAATGATGTTVQTHVVTAVGTNTSLKALTDAATNVLALTPTPSDVALAVTAAAQPFLNAPTAVKSASSDRFMELQLSFSSSDMQSANSTTSQFSQTSWGVDLFFGSASGNSSSSSSVTTANSVDTETSILVAFKAAKVDIAREWFDPGVFKLSKDMSRLSAAAFSLGGLPMNGTAIDWSATTKLSAANDALLPCFPVAFVVAKDVTIKFKATSSSLDAIHSVADSRSATGGGFLCFSASHSSASHSDSQSLHTTSDDLVVTIQMPGPQILGWFLETTPPDGSTRLDPAKQPDPDIDLIKYVGLLQSPTSGT